MRKDALLRAMVEKQFFQRVAEKLNDILTALLFRVSLWFLRKTTKIQNNKIMFITFRSEYDCNAKWIAEEIRRRNLPYEVVWTIRYNVPVDDIPEEFIKTYRGSYEFYKHLSSARIIVDNGISTAYMKYQKKPGQILMETWHGSLGIKMFSRDTNKDKDWCAIADREGSMTDYCLSNSTFEDKVYRDSFWPNTRILQLGHARNDILCEKDVSRLSAIRKKVFEEYGLDHDTRICLYAPTFRDDGDTRPYKIDYSHLRGALQERFGGNWVIFTRFHFRVMKKLKNYSFPVGVINVSGYSDIQELLTCTDVGITDYSSWICDYMLTRRPGFLFATDMEQYEEKDREFFYPLSSMPFPLALNNDQLIENVLSFDNETFVKECDAFLKGKGCIDDGHASERIADVIEQIMRGEKI